MQFSSQQFFRPMVSYLIKKHFAHHTELNNSGHKFPRLN